MYHFRLVFRFDHNTVSCFVVHAHAWVLRLSCDVYFIIMLQVEEKQRAEARERQHTGTEWKQRVGIKCICSPSGYEFDGGSSIGVQGACAPPLQPPMTLYNMEVDPRYGLVPAPDR